MGELQIQQKSISRLKAQIEGICSLLVKQSSLIDELQTNTDLQKKKGIDKRESTRLKVQLRELEERSRNLDTRLVPGHGRYDRG